MFEYFDAHSHLNLSPLRDQQEEIIKKMNELGVGTVTVGTDLETSKLAVEIAENNSNIWASVGLHPSEAVVFDVPSVLSRAESREVERHNDKEVFDYKKYLELAQHPKVVAIGEAGLDYFRVNSLDVRDNSLLIRKQKEIFLKQIELSVEIKKPLMIHCRPSAGTMDAYEDLYEILVSDIRYPISCMDKDKDRLRGNLHFFAGNIEITKKFLGLGFTFSFDGPITYPIDPSTKLGASYDEVIKFLPLESMMAETDAPFAAPVPYRGKTNYPYYVKYVVEKIAEIKGLSFEIVKKALVENAVRTFSLVVNHR